MNKLSSFVRAYSTVQPGLRPGVSYIYIDFVFFLSLEVQLKTKTNFQQKKTRDSYFI